MLFLLPGFFNKKNRRQSRKVSYANRTTLEDFYWINDILNDSMDEDNNLIRYIDDLMTKGLGDESRDLIEEKIMAEKALQEITTFRQQTTDKNINETVDKKVPTFEFILEVEKFLQNIITVLENIDLEQDEILIEESSVAEFLNAAKIQLKHIDETNEKLKSEGYESFQMTFLEMRLYKTIIHTDYIQILNLIQEDCKNFSETDKTKIHEKVVEMEEYFDIINSSKYDDDEDAESGRTPVFIFYLEYARMIEELANFYDLFKISEQGEFDEHVTQDKKIKIQQSVQKMKTHFINSNKIKEHNKSLQGYIEEYFPTIAELYCEAVDLKGDPKRKPNKALELLNKVETIYDTFGSQWENEISSDELKDIREIIKKFREGIEQNPQDSYKYILQILFKLLSK